MLTMADKVKTRNSTTSIFRYSTCKHDKPVVLKERLCEWKCYNWTIDDWARHCKDIQFKFRSSPFNSDSQWETDCSFLQATLQDFNSWLNEKPSSLPSDNPFKKINPETDWCYSSYNYMADVFRMHPELLSILDWEVFGLEGCAGNESTLWIGSHGSNTPCHQDTYGSNLVAQLVGKKLWVLFPPDASDCLYPTRVPYEESSVFSSVNILNPDLESFPRYTGSKPYLVVLKPGDVLYVPPKWWHYVISLESSVSVNTWIEHDFDDSWRLDEAVVRFAMTAFIPVFQRNDSTWINPTEELVSSSETTKLLQRALDQSKITRSLGLTNDSLDENPKDLELIEVKQLSFVEFEKEMLTLTSYKMCVNRRKKNELVDYINCFMRSNVLKAITDNLKNLAN